MSGYFISGAFVASLFMTAHAAIEITTESGGYISRQYFENGEFVLMQDEKPSLGIDGEGNCWFIDGGRRIFDTCDEMLQSMSAMRDKVMADFSADDRAMMERAMEIQMAAPPENVTLTGTKKIAGYVAACYRVGTKREICISARLLDEIRQEMGDGRFTEMFKRFGESAAAMGAESPESKAVAGLSEKGFSMLDMQQVAAPGLDSSMLKFLPEAERNLIMNQINDSGAATKMRGNKVRRVDRNAVMPSLDFSHYRRISFKQFMQHSISSKAGKWEGFPPAEQ